MKKLKKYLPLILVGAGAYYWFVMRPRQQPATTASALVETTGKGLSRGGGFK